MSAIGGSGGHFQPAQEKQGQRLLGSHRFLKSTSEPISLESREGFVEYVAAGKLKGKTALIIDGNSGIGRAISVLFAREGADITIVFLPEEMQNAENTKAAVAKEGRKCLLVPSNLTGTAVCKDAIDKHVTEYARIDVLVNGASRQLLCNDFAQIDREKVRSMLRRNVFQMVAVIKYALPYMRKGSSIINTISTVAFHDTSKMVDFVSTRRAIASFTRSLGPKLRAKNIRVNAVAPDPAHTSLRPVSLPAEQMEGFDKSIGVEPSELALRFVFLASKEKHGCRVPSLVDTVWRLYFYTSPPSTTAMSQWSSGQWTFSGIAMKKWIRQKGHLVHLEKASSNSSPRWSTVLQDRDADDENMSSGKHLPSRPCLARPVKPYCPRRPTLQEVLANSAPPPWTLSAFTAYLSQNHCLETLEFTMDATRYRKQYETLLANCEEKTIMPSAEEYEYVRMLWQKLLDTYITQDSPREINLPGDVRDHLLSSPNHFRPPSPPQLDTALGVVYELMEESVLVPFLNSVSPSSSTYTSPCTSVGERSIISAPDSPPMPPAASTQISHGSTPSIGPSRDAQTYNHAHSHQPVQPSRLALPLKPGVTGRFEWWEDGRTGTGREEDEPEQYNEAALDIAYKTAETVYLIFSVNKSGEYYGYARMTSPINQDPAAAIVFAPAPTTSTNMASATTLGFASVPGAGAALTDQDQSTAMVTPASTTAPRGHIIDHSARGTIFCVADPVAGAADEDSGGGSGSGANSGGSSSGNSGGNSSALVVGSSSDEGLPFPPLAGATGAARGRPFSVEWESTRRVPFIRTRGLKNAWNAGKEVKIAKDGTEIETRVGRKLIELFGGREGEGGRWRGRSCEMMNAWEGD
ncbi:hypothetical protein V493_00723 [Pseudogymnoascus sp. VKM F-4281 (FW-2241)]|nr:hypothetical protein V493_00723 [Pseudogymnoascus sp. VKM F-4281 (FW-2241)]